MVNCLSAADAEAELAGQVVVQDLAVEQAAGVAERLGDVAARKVVEELQLRGEAAVKLRWMVSWRTASTETPGT